MPTEAEISAEAIPEAVRSGVLTRKAARREVLSRYVALAGPVSAGRVVERYSFSPAWVERRLTEMERAGTLVRGAFGQDRTVAHWCSRRLLEQARRRELAQARKAIEAVSIADYARFMQRWQHLAPSDRLTGAEGTALVMDQLLGLARPAEAWDREYLPARVRDYDPASLGALASGGRLVWAAERATTARSTRPRKSPRSKTSSSTSPRTVRRCRRGRCPRR